MRSALALALIATASAAQVAAVQAQAVTTRIETRPYYGAITTIEHGVRVMRALPAHDRIIINPNGRTPISLNVGGNEGGSSVTQSSRTYIYNRPVVGGAFVGVPIGRWHNRPNHRSR